MKDLQLEEPDVLGKPKALARWLAAKPRLAVFVDGWELLKLPPHIRQQHCEALAALGYRQIAQLKDGLVLVSLQGAAVLEEQLRAGEGQLLCCHNWVAGDAETHMVEWQPNLLLRLLLLRQPLGRNLRRVWQCILGERPQQQQQQGAEEGQLGFSARATIPGVSGGSGGPSAGSEPQGSSCRSCKYRRLSVTNCPDSGALLRQGPTIEPEGPTVAQAQVTWPRPFSLPGNKQDPELDLRVEAPLLDGCSIKVDMYLSACSMTDENGHRINLTIDSLRAQAYSAEQLQWQQQQQLPLKQKQLLQRQQQQQQQAAQSCQECVLRFVMLTVQPELLVGVAEGDRHNAQSSTGQPREGRTEKAATVSQVTYSYESCGAEFTFEASEDTVKALRTKMGCEVAAEWPQHLSAELPMWRLHPRPQKANLSAVKGQPGLSGATGDLTHSTINTIIIGGDRECDGGMICVLYDPRKAVSFELAPHMDSPADSVVPGALQPLAQSELQLKAVLAVVGLIITAPPEPNGCLHSLLRFVKRAVTRVRSVKRLQAMHRLSAFRLSVGEELLRGRRDCPVHRAEKS